MRRRETLVLSCGRLRLSTREEERRGRKREGGKTLEGESEMRTESFAAPFSFPFINETARAFCTGEFHAHRYLNGYQPTVAAVAARHNSTCCSWQDTHELAVRAAGAGPNFYSSTPSQREIVDLIVTGDLLAIGSRDIL